MAEEILLTVQVLTEQYAFNYFSNILLNYFSFISFYFVSNLLIYSFIHFMFSLFCMIITITISCTFLLYFI